MPLWHILKMEYKDYRVEDLLNDTNFILWAKYKENDDFWTEFITHHPHKAEIVEKASKIINRLAESESIQNIRLNQDQTWYQITNRLFRDTDKPSIVINRRKSVTFFSTISAAVIIIFCVWYYVQKPKSKNSYLELTKIAGSANSLTEKINNSDKAMKIILQDSSFVVLTPGSKLSFPFNFDVNKREVFLSGKGFFSVSEDVGRPFFVNTGEVITRVLGTSFWIDNSLENQDIEVIVKTGKVTVYERKNENATASKISNGLILNANHKATFMSSNRIFKTITSRQCPSRRPALLG